MSIGENAQDVTSLRSVPFHSTELTSTINYLKEITRCNITVPNEIRMINFYFEEMAPNELIHLSETCIFME